MIFDVPCSIDEFNFYSKFGNVDAFSLDLLESEPWCRKMMPIWRQSDKVWRVDSPTCRLAPISSIWASIDVDWGPLTRRFRRLSVTKATAAVAAVCIRWRRPLTAEPVAAVGFEGEAGPPAMAFHRTLKRRRPHQPRPSPLWRCCCKRRRPSTSGRSIVSFQSNQRGKGSGQPPWHLNDTAGTRHHQPTNTAVIISESLSSPRTQPTATDWTHLIKVWPQIELCKWGGWSGGGRGGVVVVDCGELARWFLISCAHLWMLIGRPLLVSAAVATIFTECLDRISYANEPSVDLMNDRKFDASHYDNVALLWFVFFFFCFSSMDCDLQLATMLTS